MQLEEAILVHFSQPGHQQADPAYKVRTTSTCGSMGSHVRHSLDTLTKYWPPSP